MSYKTIPAIKARVHLGEIMRRAFKNHEQFIVEKSGMPMIAIVKASDYLKLVEEREKRFEALDKARARFTAASLDEVQKDVTQAIKAVRKKSA